MKTVVTGGTGFIGSNLVKRLIEEGREVTVASSFSQGDDDNLLNLGIRVECQKVDLRDYSQALETVDGAQTVFHLAARIGNLEYLHGTNMAELAALQMNLLIDANVFRACLERKVKKIVYASSVAVYPMDKQYSPGVVFSESDLDLKALTSCTQPTQQTTVTANYRLPTVNPDGGYGWAKLIGELQLNWMEGIDIGIARIFNIYGENEPLGERAHAVGDLIRKAILYPNEEFIVWGSGEQTRDFLYVSDCVDALLRLEKGASNPPITVNIGSGETVSIGTIAEKAVELSGKNIKIAYDSARSVGPISRTADIARARALLNWQPKVSLDDGLRRTYVWIQKRLGGQSISSICYG